MAQRCPHCRNIIPTPLLLLSASGLDRYFNCLGCMRRLSVSVGWKIACICVSLIALMLCCAVSVEESSWLPYLALPVILLMMALMVRHLASIRIVASPPRWIPLLNFMVLTSALYAVASITSLTD